MCHQPRFCRQHNKVPLFFSVQFSSVTPITLTAPPSLCSPVPARTGIDERPTRRRSCLFRKRSLQFSRDLTNIWPVIERVSIERKENRTRVEPRRGLRFRTFRILSLTSCFPLHYHIDPPIFRNL